MKRKNPVFVLFNIIFLLLGTLVIKIFSGNKTIRASVFADFWHFLRLGILFLVFLSVSVSGLGQKTWDGGGDGTSWSSANNWNPNGVPLSTDDVIISRNGSRTINLNGDYSCASLTLNYTGNTDGTIILNFLGINSLTVTNGVSLINTANNAGSNVILNVANGTLSCASIINTESTSSTSDISVTLQNGTINCSGNITMGANSDRNDLTVSGNGLINIGGNLSGNGTFVPGTGTVNFNRAGAQTVGNFTYYNLTLSGSGAKTTTGITVNNILSLEGLSTASSLPVYGATASLQYKGSAAQTTGPEYPVSVYNLIINNSAGVILTGSATVTNNLVMTSGNVTTGAANTLFLTNSTVGSLLYTSGSIIGNFKRRISTTTLTDYLFPVGTATFYRPASFNFSSLASDVDITAIFEPTPPAGLVNYTDGIVTVDNLFTEGYWRFKSSATPVATYSLSLTGTGFASYAVNEITRISGRDNSNATWRALGSHGTVSGNQVTRTGISNLNTASFDYAFGTGCASASLAYEFERDITIDYTKVAGGKDLSNFPVLINLTGQNYLKQSPAGQVLNVNGYDIIFTDNNYNKLDHQIEYFNGINGDFIAWVRIPTLSVTSNTNIKILYGNPQVSTDPSVTSVWDSHYKGVWHLDNNNLNDFTSFNKPATPYNSPTYPAGNIYNALGLSGGNQYAAVLGAPNTNFNGNITVSAWIYLNGINLDQKIAGNQNDATGGYKFGVYTNNKVEFEIRTATNASYLNRAVTGGTTLTTGQWYYVAGMSSDVLDSIRTFVSGVPERPYHKTGTLGTASNNLTIGREPWTGTYYWNGRIDELRISDEVRSNGWLRTEFLNQSSPSTFYSVGVENLADNLPSTSICNGSVTLTFGFPAGGTYSGTGVVGNIFTPPSAGTYSITYSYTSGCGTTTATKDIIVTDAPEAPIAPDKEYCTGTIAYLNATTGDNIRWYSGGTLASTANPFSTGITTPGIYNYTVTQTINGCESVSTPVKLSIFSTALITSHPVNQSKCAGTTAGFRVKATGPNLTYQWRKGVVNLSNGPNITGATSDTLTLLNLAGSDAGIYNCVVSSSCGAPFTSNSATLTVDPQPTPTISGFPLVCQSSSFTYSIITPVAGHTYDWTVTGGTITPPATGTSISVNWPVAGDFEVSVTETASPDCFTTTSYPVTVTATPSATISYSGSPFCSSSGTAIVTLLGNTGGIFTAAPAGLSINAATGDITPGTSAAGAYTVTYTVAAAGGCSAFMTTTPVTIVQTPPAPSGAASQSFCSVTLPTIADLAATGTAIQWYAASTGGIPLATLTVLGNGSHYYASQTVGGCESAVRLDVTVTINTTPAAPSGLASQSFCSGASPTVANLAAIGTAIQWYANSAGGTALAPATALTDATHYYASQTISGCESTTRLDVTVTVNPMPVAPTGTASQAFCSDALPTVANLTATGTAIKWYDASSGGSLLGSSTPLINGTHYYASQTVNGCESMLRFDVTAVVNVTPPAPSGSASQIFCSSESPTIASLTATGTVIQWYSDPTGGIALAPAVFLGNGNHYYASQTVNGCESSLRFDVLVTVNTTPFAPTGSSSQSFCSGSSPTVASLTATGTAIQWYANSAGGTALAPATALTDATHYYASQTISGCESTTRFDVTVTVNPTPVAPTGTASQAFCSDALPTVANLTATGTAIKWYDASSGGSLLGSSTPLINGTHYYASQTVNGCESMLRFDVTAVVNVTPPAPSGSASQIFCSSESPTIASLTATGTVIQWYSDPTGGIALAPAVFLGNGNHYYASQTVNGCESSLRFDVLVTVNTTPFAPTGSSSQSFCSGSSPTVASLTATGTAIQWYANSAGGTALAPATALTDATHYYASQTISGCESTTRFDVTVTVNPTPVAPTGTASQAFCSDALPTVANLTATGTAIKWYDASSGGSLLGSSTLLINGTHYYASQTVNGCESMLRFDVTAVVNVTPPAPTGSVSQIFCSDSSPTVADLIAAGTLIQWYDASIGGSIIPSTTLIGNGTHYYASQTINGCESTTRLDVTATVNVTPAAPTGTPSQSFCSDASPTVADLTVATGLGIKWYDASSGGNLLATSTLLTDGTHYYASQTVSGCESILRFDVTATVNVTPVAPTASVTVQPNCSVNTGTIVITAPLGAYEYSIDGVTYQGGVTFSGVAPGSYSLTARNTVNVNCVSQATLLTVNAALPPPTVTTTQINDECFGGTTGTATAIPSGGTGPYTYSWNTVPVQTTATATGLAAGPYTVTVTDANTCTATANVTITQPLALTGSASVTTPITCNGGTATVTLIGGGGTAPLSYTFNGVTNATGIFSGIPAGVAYAWSITDASLCGPVSGILDVTEPLALTGSASVTTPITCNGGTATVTLIGGGGTAPLSYTFNGVTNATGIFSGIPAGVAYAWSITDVSLCGPVSGTLDVTQPLALTGSASVTTPITCNGGTATVTLIGGGGTAPLSYTFNGVTNATGIFAGIPAGAAYAWSITDASLCGPVSGTLDVTQPLALTGSASVTTPITCNGGTATVTLIGGGGTAPLSYTFNGVTNATGIFAGIPAGAAYAWSITDASLCGPVSGTLDVTQPLALTGSASVTTPITCNGGTATVTLIGGGGTAPLSYTFNGVTNATGIFSGIPAGAAYAWSITDASLCGPVSGTLDVTQPSALTVTTTQVNVTCFGGTSGSSTATPSGGTGPYSYSWNTLPVQSTVTATGLAAGTYTVTITDANGCFISTNVTITQPATPVTGSITAQTNVLCFGDANGTVTVTGSGGLSPYTYRIGAGTYQGSGTFNSLSPGVYIITIRDANLCTNTVTATITQPLILSGAISAQTNVACFGASTGSITITAGGGTAPYQYSINAGPYQLSDTFTGLSAGTYNISVRDNNLCSTGFTVLITQPASSLAGFITAQTNTTCHGDSDGSVTIAGAGGTAPYLFRIDSGINQLSGTFNGLNAGSHTVIITDANSCTFNVSVTITQPAPLTGAVITQSNVLCFGGNTGSVTLSGAGGTSPYQYSLDGSPYQASGTFNGLTAGPHSVIVRDIRLCTSAVNLTITEPPVLTVTASHVDVACFGGITGSATATATGGTGPYSYSWNTVPVQAIATATGLSAGSYIVTVTDANGCTATSGVTIAQPATPLTVTTTHVNIACFGGTTGTATATPSGGTGPYTYSWNTSPVQTTPTATGLAAGPYIVTITDANSCTASSNVIISQPATALAVAITQVNVACFGGATGSATVTPSGGTSPYTYSWNTIPVQMTATATGLSSGSYSVTVTDANLCTAIANVTITQPVAALTISTSQVNVACFGGSSGTATAIPTGGTGSYSYSWNTLPVQTTATATGLAAGTYTVTVSDASSCTSTADVTITQPAAAMTVATTQVNVSCFGGTSGSATAIPAGGLAPYTYSWNTNPVQNTETATLLKSGSYTVTVTDANLCTASANITISEPPALDGTVGAQTNILCFGGNNGSVTVSASGGTPGYMYRIGAGGYQLSGTFNSLTAGSYNITVRDANLCTFIVPVTITQPVSALGGSISSQTNVLCFGDATGSVIISASGGTLPYEYNIDGGSYQPAGTFNGLLAGVHNVIIRDANMCSFSIPVNITQPISSLSGSIVSQTNVLCFGGSTGSVTVAGSGGTPVYQYSLDAGSLQPLGTFNGLNTGIHTVTITDANNCTFNVIVNITQPLAALTVTTTHIEVACFGGLTGSATAIPAGGTAPYAYSWNTSPVKTTATASGLAAGSYIVTVTDANLCTLTANVTITEPLSALTVTTTQVNNGCFGGTTGTATAIPSGGTGPYTYSWNTVPVQTTATATGLAAGPYTVTVTDANTCSATANVTITQPLALTGSASVTTPITCNGGTATVTLIGGGGTAPLSYTFNGVTNATGIFSGIPAGVAYAWSITDASLCGPVSGTLDVSQPLALTGSASVTTPITCNGGTATVTLIGGGGTAPLSYTFNGVTNATGIFSGIPAGAAYAWSITDVSLCGPVSGTLDVTEPLALTGSASVTTPITCNGGTATVTLIGGGGPAPLSYTFNGVTNATGIFSGIPAGASYAWSITDASLCSTVSGTLDVTEPIIVTGSASVTTPITCNGGTATVTLIGGGGTAPLAYTFNGVTNATGIFLGIPAGVAYAWSITDASLCGTVSGTLDVVEPVIVTGSVSVTTPITCNGETATVTLVGSGGTAPLSYTFNGVTNDIGIFAGIPAGVAYVWSISDAGNCGTVSGLLDVTEPFAVTGSITSQTNVTLAGGNDGSVTVAGAGGTAPYMYKLGSGSYQASGTFGSLTAGSYIITVQDINLCTADVSVIITQPVAALSGSVTSQTNACFGTASGSVTVSGFGGVLPYEYQLDAGAFQSSGTFGALIAGTYNITIKDAALSTFDIIVVITQPTAALSGLIISQTNVLCYGSNTGSVTVTGSLGTAPYQYRLNGGSFQVSGTFPALTAGNYTITVQDQNLCTFDITVTIAQPLENLVGNIVTQSNVSCSGSADGSVVVTAAGGSVPYEYSLNGGVYQALGLFSGLASGNYMVTIRDANLCLINVPVVISGPDALSIESTKIDASCPGEPDGSINLTITGGTQPYDVRWPDGLLTSSASRSNIPDGTYRIDVTDFHGCATSVTVEVGFIGSGNCIEIPQVITPNNDGYNDTWKIKNIDLFPNAEVFVFTRWGKLVYNTKNISANPWDGTFKGKLLPTDSYHYILHLNDGSKPRSGVISIIR